jgi:hypothetical protein
VSFGDQTRTLLIARRATSGCISPAWAPLVCKQLLHGHGHLSPSLPKHLSQPTTASLHWRSPGRATRGQVLLQKWGAWRGASDATLAQLLLQLEVRMS